MRDEIIDEVHAIKESLAEEYGFDIRRIVEDIKRSEAQTELEGWRHVQPAPILPDSVFRRIRFAHHFYNSTKIKNNSDVENAVK